MKDYERKTHYKMYKSHKGWLVAGITVTSMAVGLIAGAQPTQTAHADDATPTTETTSDSNVAESGSQVTLSKQETADTATGTKTPVVESTEVTPQDEQPAGDTSTETSKNGVKDQETANQGTTDKDATGTDLTGKESIGTDNNTAPKEDADSVKSGADAGTGNDATNVNGQSVDKDGKTDTNVTDNIKDGTAQKAVADTATVKKAADAAKATQTIDQWMPNKTLQNWVLQALNNSNSSTKPADVKITSVDQITPEDMLYLTSFSSQNYGTTYIDGKQSFSVEGLQYATNLTSLDLINDIDAAPHAMRGDITDISPLSTLKNLTFLQTGQSRITDITPISKLDKIKSLFIGMANISDFSSLDPTQYTKNFTIDQQFVENKLVRIPTTGQYVMVNPIKAPKGMTMTVSSPNGIGIPIFSSTYPNSLVRVFWKGGDGTLSADKSTIAYQMTKNQIMPGQTYNPYEGIFDKLVLENYTYWMSSLYSFTGAAGSSPITVAMVTPYLVANDAEPVTVNYVDEANNEIAPSNTMTGLQGDTYTAVAPIIPGYVLNDDSTTVQGTFDTVAHQINFVYRSAFSNVKSVGENILYQDTTGTKVAKPVTQSVTFVTVTDPTTRTDTVYSKIGPDTSISLDATGKPDASWTVYTDGDTIPLDAVANPTIEGMRVIKTTDAANDLTQTTIQNVTSNNPSFTVKVTYAHNFKTTTNQVSEGITYVDQDGKQVADPSTQTITFATVSDLYDGTQTMYSNVTGAKTPELNDTGEPTDANWLSYKAGDKLTLAAVVNPAVKGMRVLKTTDAANDLTQTTAKDVANDSASLAVVVTYAHNFDVTTNQVHENITYIDQDGQQVAAPATKTMTFATVTDQSNDSQVIYSNATDATAPELNDMGKPTDATWVVYQQGDKLAFAAITNPAVKGMRVVKTDDPAQDLSQVTAQNITNESGNIAFTVTYAHNFDVTTSQVHEGITYVDQSGKQVADPVTQTVTFATVTDQSNQQQVVYSNPTAATAPELNDAGQPTDTAWVVFKDGDKLTFKAVKNPDVTGMHVVSTTDPAKDLTQTTAQTVTNGSADLAVVVTYEADPVVTPPVVTPPVVTPPIVTPPVVTPPIDGGDGDTGNTGNPDTNGNGGNGGNVTAPTEEGNQPDTVKPNKKPSGSLTTGGGAATGTPNHSGAATGSAAAMVATTPGKGNAGTVQSLGTKAPATKAATATTKLPQTDEQSGNGLAVVGMALLTALAGVFGFKKRQD